MTSQNPNLEYLFQLKTKLSSLSELNTDNLAKILNFSLKEIISSNNYFDIFLGVSSNLITQAELRINKNDDRKKILILEINPSENISEETVKNEYSKTVLNAHSPNDPTRESLNITESWGKISFGFNENGVLINVIFDTTNLL